MIIQMTNEEFHELRQIIVKLNNPKATKNFNEIFNLSGDISKKKVNGFANPINKDIVISIEEECAKDVLMGIKVNAKDLGALTKAGVSITNAGKWISCLKNITASIMKFLG